VAGMEILVDQKSWDAQKISHWSQCKGHIGAQSIYEHKSSSEMARIYHTSLSELPRHTHSYQKARDTVVVTYLKTLASSNVADLLQIK
jgi:hypothetical protein